jgi:DNA-binding MarR family transcriptional regulator
MQRARKTVKQNVARPRRSSSPQAIDFERYIPTVVSRLSMKLRASAKVYFEESYGISLLDWRIISFLAAEGPSSAYDIWTLGTLDKAAVSRAVKALANRGLVSIRNDRKSSRRRSVVALTKAGQQLHDRSFDEILCRHQRLAGDLTPDQIATFIWTVQYLEDRIVLMNQDAEARRTDWAPVKKGFSHSAG